MTTPRTDHRTPDAKTNAAVIGAVPAIAALSMLAGTAGAGAKPGTLDRFIDATADALPMAVTQGRTMDAEPVDLDADGDLDLVLASEFGQNVVLLNDGDARFRFAAEALPQGAVHDSEDIAWGDLDGDGHTDLVFVSEDDQTNECYLGTRDGAFRPAHDRLPVTGVSNAVLLCDLNGDAFPDLLLGNKGQNTALLGGADGSTDATGDRLPERSDVTQDLELGDIDGDGDLDLIVANEDANRILINDGTGVFSDETDERLAYTGTIETREADLADLDGDGDLDLIFANVGWVQGADPTNRVLINDGAGVFSDETRARMPPNQAYFSLDIDAADLDADGDLDLIEVNVNGPVRLYINDGAGSFEDRADAMMPPSPSSPLAAIDVEAADFNGDGRVDLYIANHAGPDRLLLGAWAGW